MSIPDSTFTDGLLGQTGAAITGTTRDIRTQEEAAGRGNPVVRLHNWRAKYSVRSISASFATPCATPLAVIIVGFVLVQRWYLGLIAFAVVAWFTFARLVTREVGMERLSTVVGFSLYCAAAYLLLTLAEKSDALGPNRFLAGALLLFLSFDSWVLSLLLESAAAWLSRGIATIALIATVIILSKHVRTFDSTFAM